MVSALTGIAGTVVAVQGLSFLANLLVVRTLSVTEYAILTSSLSILGLLTAIADSGLSQAAMTVGGLHHESELEKAQVLKRCRSLIVRTGLVGASVVVPIWLWMVSRFDPSIGSTALAGLFLFGGFFAVLGLNIYKSFLLLAGRRVFTQKVEVARTLVRVLLLLLGITFLPNAAFVIACGFVAELGGWWAFRAALGPMARERIDCSEQIQSEVAAVFWRLLPTGVYKAVSSQVFLLLLVAFGSTAGVAGAGALGKFHQFFVFVPAVVATVLNPRLARVRGEEARTRKTLLFTAIGWLGALFIWLILMVCAGPLLGLFGSNYAGLQTELRILMSSSCMFIMAGVLIGLLNTRGWIMPPALVIGTDLCFSTLAILTCQVSTLKGFTIMNCILHGGALLTAVGWLLFCLRNRLRHGAG